MRIVILILLILLSMQSLNAQDSLYFKDLYGFEDSKGQTHLYYQQIDWFEVVGDTVNNYWSDGYQIDGNLRHLNANTNKDSVVYTYHSDHHSGILTSQRSLGDVEMLSDDPGDIAIGGTYGLGVDSFGSDILFLKTGAYYSNFWYLNYRILIDPAYPDSIYFHRGEEDQAAVAIHKDIHPDSLVKLEFPNYYDATDSLGFNIYPEIELMAISPFQDSVYFIRQAYEPAILKGNLYTESYDTLKVESSYYGESTSVDFYFDSDSAHIYMFNDYDIYRSDNFGEPGTWNVITTNFPTVADRVWWDGDSLRTLNLHVRKEETGHLYAFSKESNHLYYSTDYAETFSLYKTFDHTIEGVYHKPGTDSLYVLTIKDLFLIEGENQTLVDEVPLSAEDNELPNRPSSITLHQNYPNPFNPETTIRFELNEATSVKIDVYDVMGRHVARLLNKRTSAGQHEVIFNAEKLSSGVYFYRLVSGNESVTRSMMLVK